MNTTDQVILGIDTPSFTHSEPIVKAWHKHRDFMGVHVFLADSGKKTQVWQGGIAGWDSIFCDSTEFTDICPQNPGI